MFHIKKLIVLCCYTLMAATLSSWTNNQNDGGSIIIKKVLSSNSGTDKTSSIQATIDGHLLSIVFLEDLGQVNVVVSYATGGEVETTAVYTPNGVNFYIPSTGSYIVTFTLPNGDVYYGEFEVTD